MNLLQAVRNKRNASETIRSVTCLNDLNVFPALVDAVFSYTLCVGQYFPFHQQYFCTNCLNIFSLSAYMKLMNCIFHLYWVMHKNVPAGSKQTKG